MINPKSLSSFCPDVTLPSLKLNLNCRHLSFKAISKISLAILRQETIQYLVFQPLDSFSHSLCAISFAVFEKIAHSIVSLKFCA